MLSPLSPRWLVPLIPHPLPLKCVRQALLTSYHYRPMNRDTSLTHFHIYKLRNRLVVVFELSSYHCRWWHVAGWDRHLLTNSLCRHTTYLQSEPGPSRSPRRCLHLERFVGGCDLRYITASVQTTPEDSSVHPQLSEHMCYLNFVFLLWQWS